MPLLQKNKDNYGVYPNSEETKTRIRPFTKKPATLDREELEYTAKNLLLYGTLAFTALGVYAYLAWLAIKQAQK